MVLKLDNGEAAIVAALLDRIPLVPTMHWLHTQGLDPVAMVTLLNKVSEYEQDQTKN